MLFQDETPIDWQVLQQSPLRTLMQHFPTLMLCRGDRCGDSCGKFHAPVDQELDTVLLDVWARTWLSVRGRKVPQDQSDLFQVFVRVPTVCQLPPFVSLGVTVSMQNRDKPTAKEQTKEQR